MSGGAVAIFGVEDFEKKFSMQKQGVAGERAARAYGDIPFTDYPFYAVLLYRQRHGLDEQLHNYVSKEWAEFDSLTGKSWLVGALERIDECHKPDPQRWEPEAVDTIADAFGMKRAAIPALVAFTTPGERRDTLPVPLGGILSADSDSAEIRQFFSVFTDLTRECDEENSPDPLRCLERRVHEQWPGQSRWREAGAAVKISVVQTATVTAAFSNVVLILRGLGVLP